jgi:hypothetical protein
MPNTFPLMKGLTALSLSLGLLAGCAAPMVTAPAPGTPAATTPEAAPGATTPAQPGAAPAMPAPAAVAPMTLTGTATFRGEALKGYTVTVLDATTGQPVTLTNDLASAKGLAVLAQNLVTDASGKFSLQVVGLGAGQALRVQVTSGSGMLETVVTANGQSLGAKGYAVAQAASSFTITELTTAIAKVAAGVIRTTQVLKPEAAAPVLAKLATRMAELSAKLELDLKANPSLANDLVSTKGTDADDTVKVLVTNAGELSALTKLVAELVADVSKAAGANASDALADAKIKETLAKIAFTGTVLTGSLQGNGGFNLSNVINGQSVDANSGDLGSVTKQVTRPSSGGSSGPVYLEVGSLEDLQLALEGTATHIRLTRDVGDNENVRYRIQRGYWLPIDRPVVIDGGNHTLGAEVAINSDGVTLQNMAVTRNITIGESMDRYNVLVVPEPPTEPDEMSGAVVLNNVDCTAGYMGVFVYAPVALTVKGCSFAGTWKGAFLQYYAAGGSLVVDGSTFTGQRYTEGDGDNTYSYFRNSGIDVSSAETSVIVKNNSTFTHLENAIDVESPSLVVKGCRFDNCQLGIEINDDVASTGELGGISGNTFDADQNDDTYFDFKAVYVDAAIDFDPDLGNSTLRAANTFTGTWSNPDVSVFSYD